MRIVKSTECEGRAATAALSASLSDACRWFRGRRSRRRRRNIWAYVRDVARVQDDVFGTILGCVPAASWSSSSNAASITLRPILGALLAPLFNDVQSTVDVSCLDLVGVLIPCQFCRSSCAPPQG